VELLPFVTLALLLLRPATGPPSSARVNAGATGAVAQSSHEPLEVAVVAVLALLLNVGFLRGNLAVRFADVSLPAALLAAWCVSVLADLIRGGAIRIGNRQDSLPLAARAAMAVLLCAAILVTALIPFPAVREQVERSSLLEGPRRIVGDALDITARLRRTWPLEAWASSDPRGAMQLALYLDRCLAPTDRVLVTPYLPPSIGLARRAFAAGQGDWRPPFFNTPADQELALARMARQSVPVVIAPPAAEFAGLMTELPLLGAHLREAYANLGERDLGRGLVVTVLVSRTARRAGMYDKLALPCFR
jgi:hypothetical protein